VEGAWGHTQVLNMTTTGDGIGVGELARQVRDVFAKLESLATRLESGQFVRTDIFGLYRENVNQALAGLEKEAKSIQDGKVAHADFKALEARVVALEDERKWLIRLVLGFIILGILGAIFVATGTGGSP
jgi:hypothetical protein